MKRCSTCHRVVPPSQFYKSKRNETGLQSQCRACHNLSSNATRKVRGKAVREVLVAVKGDRCAHCDLTYPTICYDLHHLEPSEKEFHFNGYPSLRRALAEAEKCILLCSNCHRIEHQRLRDKNVNN